MMILITYNVNTEDTQGHKQLRQIAKQTYEWEGVLMA